MAKKESEYMVIVASHVVNTTASSLAEVEEHIRNMGLDANQHIVIADRTGKIVSMNLDMNSDDIVQPGN